MNTQRGTVDKFIGDAILVFFGDPETEGALADALRCARMVLPCATGCSRCSGLWRENGISRPLHARMGIVTGFCTVGNFGSDQRLDLVTVPDRRQMQEALDELRRIEADLARELPGSDFSVCSVTSRRTCNRSQGTRFSKLKLAV